MQVARLAGYPRAARAAGNALHKNPARLLYATDHDNDHNDDRQKSSHNHRQKSLYSLVPCHRVVRSDGSLGGYAGGAKKKATLLRKEKVLIGHEKIDLEKFGWRGKSC
ncbi:MAG: MGMT family protein [Candidatus Jorgensenbacteria bacterium]